MNKSDNINTFISRPEKPIEQTKEALQMLLLLLVLNQVDKLDNLLETLLGEGISGATILSSTGMIRELAKNDEYQPIFGSPWFRNDPDRKESKTIFMVLNDDQAVKARHVIHQVIGDISQPDTGVLFTLPVLSAEGIGY